MVEGSPHRKEVHPCASQVSLQIILGRGGLGKNGENTEGFISEIVKEMEDCRMWDFQWTDMPILIMINSLNSCDENEVRLAERITQIYNSSILSNKVLDMSYIRGVITEFWSDIRETRQLMFNSEENKEKDTETEDETKERDKENKRKKR